MTLKKISAIIMLLLFVNICNAAVDVVALYQMGEDDPGALAGNIANENTLESGSASSSLIRNGEPVYSSSTGLTGSSLSMGFDGNDYYSLGNNFSNATDNFGIEAWIKPTALDGFNFVCSNGTNHGGYGLIQQGGKWGILFMGVRGDFSGPSVKVGQWQHVAVVRNNGITTLYVDGIASITTSVGPKPIDNSFTIGANDKVNGGSENTEPFSPLYEGKWKGLIDSVRVFTFGPGLFDVDDLMTIPPAAATRPNPANGAVASPKSDLTVSWKAGHNSISHMVYLGKTEQGVTDATIESPEFMCTISTKSYNLVNLMYLTTYYWRVDEVEETDQGQIIQKGNTWSFTTKAEPIVQQKKETDLNNDGMVNFADFVILCKDWLAVKQTITLKSLLEEMVDREAVVRFPDPFYQCKQASSYNRASVTPDDYQGWFADSDGTQCIRTEQINGQTEWVIMEHDGPGCITHTWTPYFHYSMNNHIGPKLKVYLDGADEPVISEDIIPLFTGKRFIKPPYGFETVRAGDLYLPIPFARSCKITTGQKNFYNIINYRAYEAGTEVETFTMDAFNEAMASNAANAQELQGPTTDITGTLSSIALTEIAAGGEAVVDMPDGNKAIYTLVINLEQYEQPQALRSTVLEIICDGKQTVWCPLADFFCGVKYRAFEDWYRTAKEDGTMVSRFIMPYQSNASVKLINLSDQAINLSIKAYVKDWTWDDRSMYFHAAWRHKYPQTTQPLSDFNFVDITGMGVFIGDSLAVGVPIGGWWGEGDEKIYVDGETFPSHFGTGTEDYYGYAGGVVPAVNDFFDDAFIGQIRAECFPGGQNVQYRTRSLDAIPFTSSLSMNMEISRALFGAKVDHAVSTTSFWYAKPGSANNREASPLEASRDIPLLDMQ